MPTDKWYGKSDAPESEIDTPYSGNGVHVIASDSSSPEMDTMSQQLSSPPVVAQTRPKGGCQTAMPRRKRRRRSVRTADSTSAMDTRQESVAPSTLDSERIHTKSESITKGEPILKAAPPASHRMAQPKCSDCSRADPLPSGSGRLSPAGHDTPADKPPAEMNICHTPDNLQIELSVMTVTSERWMERFVMNPQVLCLDGLTSDYDPEDRWSDVDGEEGVFQDPMPEVVSVRPEVTEKWMDRFVVDLVESPSVSRKSEVAQTFGPAVSEEYSPVVFAGGGGGGCRCIPPGGRRVGLSSGVWPVTGSVRPSSGVCPTIGGVRYSASVCPARCRL